MVLYGLLLPKQVDDARSGVLSSAGIQKWIKILALLYLWLHDPQVLNGLPDGIIDEIATSGVLKVYREFNFPRDIRAMFVKEKRPQNSFTDAYLGETPEGPTTQVMVVLQVERDISSLKTLDMLLADPQKNIQFINAYPVKLK